MQTPRRHDVKGSTSPRLFTLDAKHTVNDA